MHVRVAAGRFCCACVRGCVRACVCVCVCVYPHYLCSETISDSLRTAGHHSVHTLVSFPTAHLHCVLSPSLLNHRPHSRHSTVFSPTPIGPLAHCFWFWFDAVLHLFLSWATLYQSSPTFTAVRSFFADSSISFADLCSVVSWATTQKDTALRAYSPASRKHVQANPDDVSSVSFLLSRCLALLSHSC